MRQQGRIDKWQDDRGFGFITPDNGSQRVFVHITSFSKRGRRPSAGSAVTYLVKRDRDGRLQAAQVAFANPADNAVTSPDQTFALVLAAAALLGVAVAVGMGKLPVWVMLVYVTASLLAFLVYAIDKSAARHGRWRVSEQTLHLFALAGGWPGALIAQRWLRHKSKKASFQSTFWVTVVLNGVALGWLYLTGAG
jgi:uncharacterized membrane protein YsdA (DUF1294 family)/cold shock CspA family protein